MLALRTFKALAAESSRHSNFWVLLDYKYGKEKYTVSRSLSQTGRLGPRKVTTKSVALQSSLHKNILVI